MSLIKLQQKIGVMPDGIFGPNTLKFAANYFGLTKLQAVHFFAQCAHESANFSVFTENLNYSSSGLLKIFPKYFPNKLMADSYARQPQKIANRVYANRMGNGAEQSGDGWKYRGRGAIQLTGKNNYTDFAMSINKPEIITNPDLVATDYSFESAIYFFKKANIFPLCERGFDDETIKLITKKINGGYHGLDDRIAKTRKYSNWM